MKVKVTFIFENNVDASILGDHPNEHLKTGYTLLANMISALGDDKMTFHSAELLDLKTGDETEEATSGLQS